MNPADKFQLCYEFEAHEMDVRALVSGPQSSFFSASRDKSVRWWCTEDSGKTYFQKTEMHGHSHFVNTLSYIPPTRDFLSGLVVSGSMDKLILIWDPETPSDPVFTLIGHKDTVCALDICATTGDIISGSWDKTAMVWKNMSECKLVLEGHQQAVWGVLSWSTDVYVTASADKTIKIWNLSKCTKTLTGHSDVVRDLARISESTFVSSSNDSTCRIWNIDGSCLLELHGHTSFVYSVNRLNEHEYVSSGEDRSVRIWKNEICSETILLPATSIWATCVLANGDIVAGANDGKIRVFTRNGSRFASAGVLKAYEDSVEKCTINAKELGGVNKEKLPDLGRLSQPGKKDQEVVMIRNGSTVEAHQWNASSQTWLKLGEVVDAIGNSKKQIFDGREYDHVFDVDIKEGAPPLKLPYNCSENPYTAAQEFIFKNELPQEYLDQVAQFIVKNTEGKVVGQSRGDGNLDPYTSSAPRKLIPLPANGFLKFAGGNIDAMKKKITELCDSGKYPKDISLEPYFSHLSLNGSSKPIDCTAIVNLLNQTSADVLFPILDLLRMLALTQVVNFPSVEKLMEKSLISENPASPNAFLVLRTICNMFQDYKIRKNVFYNRKEIMSPINKIKKVENKNLALSLATLFLNFSIALNYDIQDEDVAFEIMTFLEVNFASVRDEETIYREIAAIGNLAYKYPRLEQFLPRKGILEVSTAQGKVGELAKEIMK